MIASILKEFKNSLDIEKRKIINQNMDIRGEQLRNTLKDQQFFFSQPSIDQDNSQEEEEEKKFQSQSESEYQYSRDDDYDNDDDEQLKYPQNACKICYTDEKDLNFVITSCQHSFHFDCLVEYVTFNIMESNFPLRCPQHKCQNKIIDQDVKDLVLDHIYQKYVQFQVKDFINKNSKLIFCCMTPNCQYWRFKQCIFDNYFFCEFCGEQYCSNHEIQWHRGQTCKEYDITHQFTKNDRKFNLKVKDMKLKRCPHCGFWVEKNRGCDFIDCKCGGHFCYLCDGTHESHKCPHEAQIRKRIAQAQQAKKNIFRAKKYIPPKFDKPLQLSAKAQNSSPIKRVQKTAQNVEKTLRPIKVAKFPVNKKGPIQLKRPTPQKITQQSLPQIHQLQQYNRPSSTIKLQPIDENQLSMLAKIGQQPLMTVSEILLHEKTIEAMIKKSRELPKIDINLQFQRNVQMIKIPA